MLELESVSSGYGRLPVLFGVNLTVQAGEMVGVLGPNGAGKSTLLKTILGILPAKSGTISFSGERVTHEASHQRFSRGISLCPEGRQVFKNLTVRENLLSGSYGKAKDLVSEQLEVCYEMFPRLSERREQRAGSLSGGEQQMLAIARALMSRPRLLLVDELSMGLGPLVVAELMATLRKLCDRGLGLIVVDQFASRMVGLADRAELIEKGSIVYSGPVEEAEVRMSEKYMGEEILAPAKGGK